MPNGKKHDGCFRVDDVCPSDICKKNKQHFDIFVGRNKGNV